MKTSGVNGTGHIAYRFDPFAKKVLIFMTLFFLAFSMERGREDIRLAQKYFHRGYIEYRQENYLDAISEFSKSFLMDRSGYYGELSYLYIGISHAKQSYRVGKKEGILAAIAYLNMYPYHYKKPTYIFLQREFIGDAYLLLGFYEKARDVFLKLYRDTGREDYLLKFLYADSLSGGSNSQIIDSVNPETLTELRYFYHLVKGFYAFNANRYSHALKELSEARNINKYVEEDPEFLYRYAVSSYMEKNLGSALLHFEQLRRRDIYRKYSDTVNYYLALIYLMKGNYADAKRRVMDILNSGGLKASLLLSQLWLYPEFLEKYSKELGDYKGLLLKISWTYLNSVYSNPAILGVYYYTIKERRIQDPNLLRLKRVKLPKEIIIEDIRIETETMLSALRSTISKLDPYGEDANLLISLYKINSENYALLFGYEKLARALAYLGDAELKNISERLEERLRGFLLGQLLLLEGSEDGLRMIESSLQGLIGEDRLEALFIRGIYRRDIRLLEGLVEQELPQRVLPYLEPALLELGDFYYGRMQYEKAKVYYRRYLEMAQESDLYWLTAYKLAKSGELTKDDEAIQWVVEKAKGSDNIISRVIITIWG